MMHDSSTSRDQLLHNTTQEVPFWFLWQATWLVMVVGECVGTGIEHTTASCAQHTMHGTTTEWHYGTPTLV